MKATDAIINAGFVLLLLGGIALASGVAMRELATFVEDWQRRSHPLKIQLGRVLAIQCR
jgi:hypothetical protein